MPSKAGGGAATKLTAIRDLFVLEARTQSKRFVVVKSGLINQARWKEMENRLNVALEGDNRPCGAPLKSKSRGCGWLFLFPKRGFPQQAKPVTAKRY